MKVYTGIILFILCLFLSQATQAQQADSVHLIPKKIIYPVTNQEADLNYQIDVVDLIQGVFRKRKISKKDTLNKQKGKLYTSVIPAIGYSLNTKFAVSLGLNGALYTDTPDSVNLSSYNIGVTVTVQKQLIVPFQTNIWTKRNKYNLLGNWTLFKFPEITYGLGGHTSLNNPDPIDYAYFLFRETVLRSIRPDFFLGLGYNLDYHWNISESGLKDKSPSDFDKYGFSPSSTSSGIAYNFLFDTRRNPLNPPKGGYVNVIMRTNYTFLGSDKNWSSLTVDLRKYFKLSKRSKNVLAFWRYTWLTINGQPPYLDLPATAWDTYSNQGRGYIQSRFRGKDLLALEGEYRFGITRNGFLGGVVFGTAQSVPNWPNYKFDKVWPGVGTGIRFKFNKFSNTNVAVDYAIGLGGSRGFFVNLGEVF